jgi:hypothetical protein
MKQSTTIIHEETIGLQLCQMQQSKYKPISRVTIFN